MEDEMTEIGAHILVESERVGVPPRTGVVIGIEGVMLRVHWDSGEDSSFVPAAGAVRVTDAPTAPQRPPAL
jgi:hypothetical protein